MCKQHVGINQQWGLSNELFVLGDSLVLTVLGQVSFMPVLVLAARLCPEVQHHLNAIHICLHSLRYCCMICSVTSIYCLANGPETSTMLPVLANSLDGSCFMHGLCTSPMCSSSSSSKKMRGDSIFDTGASHIISIAAQGVEATLFATLMSVLNGGAFAGSTLGALLTKSFGVTSEDFTNLAPLVTVCTLSSLLPLPLLRMLPQGSTTEQIQSNNDQESGSA
jgi:hypothetical protein